MKVASKVATKELAMERRRARGRRSDAVAEWVSGTNAVPEAGAPMVGFNAGWNDGVRLEVAELFKASGTCGRCCGL